MRVKQLTCWIITVAFFNISVFAQKNSKGLINAEKAFAAFTQSHTIKEGFLKYMDSAGLVFRQGIPTNALQVYQQQKAGPGILSWAPNFAVISASGDMGVTAGPYTFREKSLQDTPVSKGTFSSIWHLNKKGEWKNLADLGVTNQESVTPVVSVEQISLKNEGIITFSIENILLLDHKLNDAIRLRDKENWQPYLSAESRLNTEGHAMYKGVAPITAALLTFPKEMVLESLSGEIASSRDFAYTYGTVSIGNKKDNYLRAWIYRKGRWETIMQTIKW